ncbi:MAG: HTH-type transcriptional regulator/antitoxin HigA [Methyloprofundus sp.]|nr:MAG: HTH-type transcriptional regulator/antitoxin HigA [Methyloprofundus sp.]
MNFQEVKEQASALFSNAEFLVHIKNQEEYESALSLMDELIEEYDLYKSLIDILSNSIEEWENSAKEFSEFNGQIKKMDSSVAVLRTLMQQYGLKTNDFKNEIGGKSMVSMILNGSRMLSRHHIQALSTRFHISPAVFFEHV